VVLVAAAVEDGLRHADGLGALGEQLADALGLVGARQAAQLGLGPVDRGERATGVVVDELCADPAVRAEHRDARPLGRAVDLRADATAAPEAPRRSGENGHARFPTFRATYSPS
jgi:hypothetical protein